MPGSGCLHQAHEDVRNLLRTHLQGIVEHIAAAHHLGNSLIDKLFRDLYVRFEAQVIQPIKEAFHTEVERAEGLIQKPMHRGLIQLHDLLHHDAICQAMRYVKLGGEWIADGVLQAGAGLADGHAAVDGRL